VGIEKWKASIEDLLFHQGRIGTLFGNYRYRDVHGELNARERRWAVSQVVQGTGSLILKRAIIEIKKKLPEVSILLPMHDALLVEIPERSASEIVEELLTQLRRTFIEICPFVVPSVKVKSFA
jgi:DNA polymerase I-like protein with 3'-5' exonuclease and polymerase domains